MTTGWSEFAANAIYPTPSAIKADNDLRVASLTIAAYDYLVTLPAEYRLYKSSNHRSSGLVLFVLIRYTSVFVLVASNVGFFYHNFTPNVCEHLHLVVPALQGTVVQIMVSQAILAIRTYNISQRKPWVGRALLSLYIMATGAQWFTSLFSRIPVMIDGNCSSASVHPQRAISAWSFYLVATLFDCLALSIAAFYLVKIKAVASAGNASRLVKIILYDGLGYFVALALSNAANIILFRGTDHAIQTTGASLGYAFTWIMSQRILIHLHEARADQKFVAVNQLPPSRQIPSAPRFDEEKQDKTTNVEPDASARPEGTLSPWTPGPADECGETESNFELRVRIERSIVLDNGSRDTDSEEQDFNSSPSGSQKSVWEEYDV